MAVPHLKERREFLDDAERLGSIAEASKGWQVLFEDYPDVWESCYNGGMEPLWAEGNKYRRRPGWYGSILEVGGITEQKAA